MRVHEVCDLIPLINGKLEIYTFSTEQTYSNTAEWQFQVLMPRNKPKPPLSTKRGGLIYGRYTPDY
jgi:hypothetical protein